MLFATLLGALWYGESLAPAGWLGGAWWRWASSILFAKAPVEEETSELTEHMRLVRNQRALFWLVMLNAGAVLLVMGFGSLLAWLALIALLHLGAGPLNQLLDGRFKGPKRS